MPVATAIHQTRRNLIIPLPLQSHFPDVTIIAASGGASKPLVVEPAQHGKRQMGRYRKRLSESRSMACFIASNRPGPLSECFPRSFDLYEERILN